MPLEVIHIFNDDCTCATYWCSGGLENFVFDLWHNRRRMQSSSAAIETHELCLEVNVPNMVPEPGIVVAVYGWTSGEHGGALWPVVRAAPVCTGLSVVEGWPRLWELGTACVAVGPRVWLCGSGRRSLLTLVFSREDLRHYGYRIRQGYGRVKPLCVYFPYYYHRRGYMELTPCSSSQWMSVAVGPCVWQCGTWLTLVFSREDLRHYGYGIRLGWGRVKPLCVYFPYYYPGRGYIDLTACSSSQWVGVAVGPRAWQCGTWLTLVFSREDLRHYGYRIRLGWGRVKPLCVYFPYHYPGRGYIDLTACSSSQWVGVAVGPRAWQCGNWMTLVFSWEDLRRYGYRIHLGLGCVNPLCVYFPYYLGLGYTEPTTCSCQWVGVAGCWSTWVWWLWLRPLWVHHILITI